MSSCHMPFSEGLQYLWALKQTGLLFPEELQLWALKDIMLLIPQFTGC